MDDYGFKMGNALLMMMVLGLIVLFLACVAFITYKILLSKNINDFDIKEGFGHKPDGTDRSNANINIGRPSDQPDPEEGRGSNVLQGVSPEEARAQQELFDRIN